MTPSHPRGSRQAWNHTARDGVFPTVSSETASCAQRAGRAREACLDGASGSEFEQFYAATYGRLVRQLYVVVGNRDEAEDLVQEAFARAAACWQRLRGYDLPEAWVRRVALNLSVSRLRRIRRGVAALARHGVPPDVPPPDPAMVAVAAALRRLPLRQRQVVVLYYVVQLPIAEIASQLALRPGTVKSRLARARATLARELADAPGTATDGPAREGARNA